MSATLQTPSIGTTRTASTVIVAAVLALAIGAAAGSLITRAVVEREASPQAVSVVTWDAGKIAAMEGRVLAEQVTPAITWDAGKIAAMEGRVLAGTAVPALGWDEAKLAAMRGRMIAEGVGG